MKHYRWLIVIFLSIISCFLLYHTVNAQCDCSCPPNTYCATFTPTFIPTNTMHPIFQTATAAGATPSPTRTTVSLQTLTPSPTATFFFPNTPTQEIAIPTVQATAIDNFSCYRVVALRGLNVRRSSLTQAPNTTSPIVSSIPQGTFLKVYDQVDNAGYTWGRVGQTTWIALQQGSLILAERASRTSCINTPFYP